MVAPLLLAAGIQAGGSLLGGLLQSNSANKAAKTQERMQREAIAAQQQAADRVQALQAPGVDLYGAGINALTGRLGLPSSNRSESLSGIDNFDAAAYRAQNPDVAQRAAQLVSEGVIGAGKQWASPDEWAAFQYANSGRGEGRAAPTVAATPQATGNALTGNPGTFGHTADPTWDAPDPFSFDIADFVNNPAYQFALEQGSGQVMANASATGALQSGAALKALQDRGQKTGYQFYDNERNNAYGQWLDGYKLNRANYESDRNYLTDRFDRGTDDIYRVTGIGQNALNGTTNAIVGAGNATANGLENIGAGQAANALAQGNIWSGVAGDLGGIGAGLVSGRGSSKSKNQRG
jgi:hypothetical protein